MHSAYRKITRDSLRTENGFEAAWTWLGGGDVQVLDVTSEDRNLRIWHENDGMWTVNHGGEELIRVGTFLAALDFAR